jgi:dolichol kinase
VRDELPRRFFHALGCLSFPIAALSLSRDTFLPLLLLASGIFMLFELVRLSVASVNLWFVRQFSTLLRESEKRRLNGSSYIFVAAALLFLIFDYRLSVLALVFLGVGDPAGGAIGRRWGKRRFGRKSLEGSAAFLFCALGFGLVINSFTQVSVLVVLAGVISSTLVEFLSLPPDDNLTVPLLACGAMTAVSLIV